MRRVAAAVALLVALTRVSPGAEVTYERLQTAARDAQNWLTYSGTYMSQRFSQLTRIQPGNVRDLELAWVHQAPVAGPWEATPLVVDGVMYVTERLNDVVALDAKTGAVFWVFRYAPAEDRRVCCGSNNRGLAILGDTLFMGTLDAQLIAIDARSGRQLWKVSLGDWKAGYSLTLAPLVVKDKVIVGMGGGDFGIRGFIGAYDARTGREVWRFDTIPGPGQAGHETWEKCPPATPTFCDPDAWTHGGGSVWVTGSYDPALNLTYWGVGNPGPDWNPAQRPGDNLYTDSVVALDADTGELKWHFQFTPHDPYDYDSANVPVLADMEWKDSSGKLMFWANRNGFFYVLDRVNGRFLRGEPFVKVNWAAGLSDTGRPHPTPQPAGSPTWPGAEGGTNWYSPSFSPRTGLFYVSAWEDYASLFRAAPQQYTAGRGFGGGGHSTFTPDAGAPTLQFPRRGPINTWTEAVGHGAVVALDPRTGKVAWKFAMHDVTDAGILTTASNLLFTGGREGYFYAFDARTGAMLWKAMLGGQISAGPITYEVEGRQYVGIVAGQSLFTFALRR